MSIRNKSITRSVSLFSRSAILINLSPMNPYYNRQDGLWGLTYEHSAGEAPAILSFFETITEKVDSMSSPEENFVPSHLPAPEKMEWCLSEQSLNDIRDAMMSIDA